MKTWYTFIYLLILIWGCANHAIAQVKKPSVVLDEASGRLRITGVVLDESGFPYPGAEAKIRGSEKPAVQTDFDGVFTISAKPGEVIEVTYIGTAKASVTAAIKSNFNIVLRENWVDTGLVIYDRYVGRLRGVAATYIFNYE